MNGDEPLEPQEPAGSSDVAPPPLVPGESVWESQPPLSPGSRKPAAYAAVIIGLLAMIGGAVFFVRSVASTSGASSPEEALRRFLTAVSTEDMFGVLETMASNERELFAERLPALTKELGRLGILRPDVDLHDVPGVDLEFTGLTMRSRDLKEGLAAVEITGGRSTYRVDPALSPVGDFVRGLLPRSAFAAVRGSDDLSDDDIVFATVREGDQWYVSFFYTIAEAARREANVALPTAGERIAARGARTPEGALDELIRAGFALDLRRVIELLPRDEAGALQDYAPLFLPNVEATTRDVRDRYQAKIRELTFTSRKSGDDYLVKVNKIDFTVEIPEVGVSIDYDGRCATLQGEVFGTDEPIRECSGGFGGALPVPPIKVDAAVTVVERDGLFYVSPLRTVVDSMIAAFKAMTPQALEDIRDFFLQFGGFEGGFEPLPESLETLAPRT